MNLIDTHTHLFAAQFDEDRNQIVEQAIGQGVQKMFLPNIDVDTLEPMLALHQAYPENCFPMAGLHPSDVKADYISKLSIIEQWIEAHKHETFGIGETGLDYYWDKTFIEEQKISLERHCEWAKTLDLPLILHTRESFADNIKIVESQQNGKLKGIFHCFTGTVDEAKRVIDAGFLLGIGGVITFKNSGESIRETLSKTSLKHMVLETDAPYLAPHPHRGKRNESAYITLVAEKLAEIKVIDIKEVADITSQNANDLFFRN